MPLRLELRASRWLTAYLIAGYGGGAVIAALLPLHPVVSLSIGAAALAIGVREFARRVLLRGAAAITGLVWTPAGKWVLLRGDGTVQETRLLPGCYVHPRLTVLRFAGSASSVVLFPDSVDRETFRRLRARLRR